jgi:PAS domain S-box-containing protein
MWSPTMGIRHARAHQSWTGRRHTGPGPVVGRSPMGEPMDGEDKFRALLEAAPDAIVIVDEQGRIELVNAQAERLFGYDRSELMGQSVDLLVPDRVRAAHAGHRQMYLEAPRTRPMGVGLSLTARRRDGSEVPVEISLSPLRTPSGVLTMSAIRDVTERTRAEERFRALLESAPDAMVIVDERGSIVLVNAQTERLFGYPRQELLGAPVELLVPARYRHAHVHHRTGYAAAAHPRPMGAGLELYGVRKDGTEFPVEISLSPLMTAEGALVVSAIRDITERKASEAERVRLLHERAAHAEANRVKDEFLATLSHELRTPLNAILGWTTLVRDGAMAPEMFDRAIQTIERNARAQASLIEDLLDVSRIVSGNLRLQVVPLDLCQVVENAADVVRPAADANRVRIEIAFAVRPLLMMGDPDRLQQVVWNLLSNAVKFSHPEGRVHVDAWVDDGDIRLSVRDSGRGIAPTFLPYVFDRFRQADSSYARPGGGLGLGLAIVRSVVELHGGRVEARSAGEGHGATFSVSLPTTALPADAPVEVRRSGARGMERLDGIRVLVVDDRADERDLLETILVSRGATVDVADSAASALQLLRRRPPTVLVSDIAMPDQDGYALLRRIRAMPPPLGRLPAVAVTAHARAEERAMALRAGFQEYVPKPVDPGRLIRAVRELATRTMSSQS